MSISYFTSIVSRLTTAQDNQKSQHKLTPKSLCVKTRDAFGVVALKNAIFLRHVDTPLK